MQAVMGTTRVTRGNQRWSSQQARPARAQWPAKAAVTLQASRNAYVKVRRTNEKEKKKTSWERDDRGGARETKRNTNKKIGGKTRDGSVLRTAERRTCLENKHGDENRTRVPEIDRTTRTSQSRTVVVWYRGTRSNRVCEAQTVHGPKMEGKGRFDPGGTDRLTLKRPTKRLRPRSPPRARLLPFLQGNPC